MKKIEEYGITLINHASCKIRGEKNFLRSIYEGDHAFKFTDNRR